MVSRLATGHNLRMESKAKELAEKEASFTRRPENRSQSAMDRRNPQSYYSTMSATKVAISMDETLLQRLDRLVKTRSFRSRSQVVQEAVSEKISRMDKSALARECAKLDRKSEQAMADEGLATEISAWPKY